MTPYRLVHSYRCFGGALCPHICGLCSHSPSMILRNVGNRTNRKSVTYQKTWIWLTSLWVSQVSRDIFYFKVRNLNYFVKQKQLWGNKIYLIWVTAGTFANFLNQSGNYMYHLLKQLKSMRFTHTVYFRVFHRSQNRQLFPWTAIMIIF